MIVIKVKL